MKNKIFALGLMFLTLVGATSCHEENDVVMSYANNDELSFNEAQNSFAGKYRVFWKALNINYTLWDYEKQNGLDWDEHYATFLPKFQALDEKDDVTDEELQNLMNEMVAPLHDGHFVVEFQNHKTNKFISASPSAIRNMKIDEYSQLEQFTPDLSGYSSSIVESKEYNSSAFRQLRDAISNSGPVVKWAQTRYDKLIALPSPTESEAAEASGLSQFLKEVERLRKLPNVKQMLTQYNIVALRYSYLNIPNLDPIDETFIENGVGITYNLFNDGIAYLYISGFALTPYLSEKEYYNIFDVTNSHTTSIARYVADTWTAWFDAIQRLHKQNKLKGVIIDVRNNGGGYMDDFQYVLGSLMEKGGFQVGWNRFKRGLGRYDYSPLTPFVLPTMNDDHEIINDVPVVVLANIHSVSMAEITSAAVKLMPNGKLIGTRTHGGLCGLNDISTFSLNYNGHIGIEYKTPVYCYTPCLTFLDMEKKVHEGVGVEPDINISLDYDKFVASNIDNQLDRALQYIRTGN